jgi:hypothetical protein
VTYATNRGGEYAEIPLDRPKDIVSSELPLKFPAVTLVT